MSEPRQHDPLTMIEATQAAGVLEEIRDLLQSILRAVTGSPVPMPYIIDLSDEAVHTQHLRLRSLGLIVGGSTAAGSITLAVGSRSFTVGYPAGESIWLPLELLIERGTDVQVATVPTGATVYLLTRVDGLGDGTIR